MTDLIPIQLDDDTIIYIQAVENVKTPAIAPQTEPNDEAVLLSKSKTESNPKSTLREIKTDSPSQTIPHFQQIDKTIKAYTNYALKAFKEVATANVDKVTLEFGINIGGSTGIPFVTQGTVGSNLKITVECTFPPTPAEEK